MPFDYETDKGYGSQFRRVKTTDSLIAEKDLQFDIDIANAPGDIYYRGSDGKVKVVHAPTGMANPVLSIASTIPLWVDTPSAISLSATVPIIYNGSGNFSHALSGVTPSTYNNVTVDAFGHINGGTNVSYLTSLAHTHGIADIGGVQQFTFAPGENVRIGGTGNMGVTFDAATKKIVIVDSSTMIRLAASGDSLPDVAADLDTIFNTVSFFAFSATNIPIASNGYLLSLGRSASFSSQFYLSDNNDAYYFRRNHGGWQPWRRFWTSADFTDTDISNWNTAYSWQNHAGRYVPLTRILTINGVSKYLASDQSWDVGTVTSVNASASGALNFSGGPITTNGNLSLGWTGGPTQYVKGDGSLATFPSLISTWTNDVGYITSLSHTHTIANAAGTAQFSFAQGDAIRFDSTGSATISFDAATKTIIIGATAGSGADGNNYTASLGFDIATGLLTATRNGLSTLSQSLDGRYLTSFTETDPVALAKTITMSSGSGITVSGASQALSTNPSFGIAISDSYVRALLSSGTGISYNSTTGVIGSTITQYTDSMARAALSLTTTGTSGLATYNPSTGALNIPNYGGGFVNYWSASGLNIANNNSGNVLVNTSDASASLNVGGAISGYFTGAVGIGTNSPLAPLHVSASSEALRIEATLPIHTYYSAGSLLGSIGYKNAVANLEISNVSTGSILFKTAASVNRMTIENGGDILMDALKTGITPPVTSGTIKSMVVDENGLLSWVDTPPNIALTHTELALTADQALTIDTWTDVLTITLSAGTWYVAAHATCIPTNSTTSPISIRIRDTTHSITYAASSDTLRIVYGTNLALSYMVYCTETTTVKLQIRPADNSNVIAKAFSYSSGDNATAITAVRVGSYAG